MTDIEQWQAYFKKIGVTTANIQTNRNVISFPGLPGEPLFRAVASRSELDDLHTKARAISAEIGKLLVLALPMRSIGSICSMPGDLILPRFRVYGGHFASSYALNGHQIENEFSVALKKEVSLVISEGTKSKTPLCDWLLKLVGSSWVYGKPSSKEQLDSLINLAAKDPGMVGHVRARQLSFGRGCDTAFLLPNPEVKLYNNQLKQQIFQSDYRFISSEIEHTNVSSARHRVYSVITSAFLSVLAEHDPRTAQELGCGSHVGASTIGEFPTKKAGSKVTPDAKKQNTSERSQTLEV